MSVSGAVADACDWAADTVRMYVFGLPAHSPEILKLAVDELTVRRAAKVQLEARWTCRAFLRVRQGNEILFEGPVPRNGRVTIIPLTPALVELNVTLESRQPAARYGTLRFASVLEPAPNGPPIESFTAPATVTLGGDIGCGWSVPQADRVRLTAIQDGEVVDNIGPPIGQLVVPAPRSGRVLLRLTAETGWGSSTLTRTCTVAPPDLRLILLRPAVQYGYPGQTLRYEWKMTGAESGWLIGPADDAPQRLPDKDGGFLFVKLGLRPAEFQVIARGHGGAERSVLLRALPNPVACLESDYE